MNVTVKVLEFAIEDQKIAEKALKCTAVARNGFTFDVPADYTIEQILHVIKSVSWSRSINFGLLFCTPALIEAIYMDRDMPVQSIGNITIYSGTLQIKHWRANYYDLMYELSKYKVDTLPQAKTFCEHYAHMFVHPKIVKICIEHTIPKSIWRCFGTTPEHMFILLSNTELLTVVDHNCHPQTLIGLRAYVADIANMILHDKTKVSLTTTTEVVNIYQYAQQYAQYFNTTVNLKYIQYLFAEDACKLSQVYRELRGEITKILFPQDADVIDSLLTYKSDRNDIQLIIFALALYKVYWAQQTGNLPTGRGDVYGIKKYIRMLFDIWPVNREMPFYDMLPEAVQLHLRTYACKTNSCAAYVHDKYLKYTLFLEVKQLKRLYNLFCSLAATESTSTHYTQTTCIEQLPTLISDTLNFIEHNIVKGNKQNELRIREAIHMIRQYIDFDLLLQVV
jgi:hypothetical protein